MFITCKTLEVAGSHSLKLDYGSPCQRVHGHNWIIKVWCRSESVDKNGMVVDFSKVKKIVHGTLDHENINEVVDFNPTAENIAYWIVQAVPFCFKAEIWESRDNYACYEKLL